MKLVELIGKKILWDATPQSEGGMIEIHGQAEYDAFLKRLKERAGYYFYINVWNCTANLAVMEQREDGSGRSEYIENSTVTELDLYRAIEEVGGAINLSGHYPISAQIKKKLQMHIGILKDLHGKEHRG